MDKDQKFLTEVQISDVPWGRLVTTYGRATDFQRYFDALGSPDAVDAEKALDKIGQDIEHQNTLWPATPFAMIFLARVFEKAVLDLKEGNNRLIISKLLDWFVEITETFNQGDEMEHDDPLPHFEDMLKEEYLWPEDEEDDEEKFEEEEIFPDNLFYSFYYYSNEVLKYLKEKLQPYSDNFDNEDIEISDKTKYLLSIIK